MQRYFLITAIMLLLLVVSIGNTHAASRWGANYFPNVSLTTHEGKTVSFFDDLIKDKIVVINFIYTSCPDTCPLETAQLTRVQRILGDRLGNDIFFYSITIDPETDTVSELKKYRDKFGAKWTFLTGNKTDIITLRRKLGLYIEEIQDGSNNHNVNMIIGNQTTGRWMKRSPFENPYVLADQIGNWLADWKSPQHVKDFANAPELRNISDGEKLFRTRCISCHTIDGSNDSTIGPDLLGVTLRRDRRWLIDWLKAPDEMLAKKDPIAMALLEEFNDIPMPNMRLSPVDVSDLLRYMQVETQKYSISKNNHISNTTTHANTRSNGDVVGIMNAWIRESQPDSLFDAGYMTLINVSDEDVTLIKIESSVSDEVEVHEMRKNEGMMEMRKLSELVIPAGGQIQLKPGGKHLMLKTPALDLVEGENVDLTLVFNSGKKQNMTIKVAAK